MHVKCFRGTRSSARYRARSTGCAGTALGGRVSRPHVQGPSGGGRGAVWSLCGQLGPAGRPRGRKQPAQQVGARPRAVAPEAGSRWDTHTRARAPSVSTPAAPAGVANPPSPPAEGPGPGPVGSGSPRAPAGTGKPEALKGNSRACPAPRRARGSARHAGKELPGKGTGLNGCGVRDPVSPPAGGLRATAALAPAWGRGRGRRAQA